MFPTAAAPTADAATQISLLHNIQDQLQSGQPHIRWYYAKPFIDAEKQSRIRSLTWSIYASMPFTVLIGALMYIYMPDARTMLPLIVGMTLAAEAIQLFWGLPRAKRKLQQQTHQNMHMQIDRKRQRVVVMAEYARHGQIYAFHTTPSCPSDLHLLGGAPQQPTAGHMQLYRDVQCALQHTTGLMFA